METYLARLTPVGRAAMATLALRGPHAWAVVRPLFQRPLPEQPEMGRFWLGRLGDGAAADEVVLSVKQGEPRPWVEIHCHGGGEVVRLLEETLVQRGVLACSWEEWEQHFTMDLARTQAQIALAHAPTTRAAAILLDQYHGAWASEWRTIRALREGNPAEARQRLARLARLVPLGRHLTVPWRVVIAGAPNVGKSSLINALAGYQRSVVAPTPGTTRDVVTTTLAIDGWPVEVADTAGWRDATEDLEREGIARANAAARQADLRLWVLDAATTPKFPQNGEEKWHFVINKIDLPAAWNLAEVAALRVSAVRGDGLGELCQAIGQWLVPEAPPPGAAVPFTPELCDAVERLADCRTPLGDL